MDFNKVWQNFMSTVTGHYMDFNGRVGQQQFWFYCIVWVVFLVIAGVLGGILGIWLIMPVVGLALLLPTGGIAARRIQDSGNNGQLAWIWVGAAGLRYLIDIYYSLTWYSVGLGGLLGYGAIWQLINLAAGAASIMIIYFGIQKGTQGDNQYGPPPPVWTPS